MLKKKVLLTGASGTVGIKIFEELLSRKDIYDIRLFLRGSKKNRTRFKPYENLVEIIWGILENPEDVRKAVMNQEIIIHVAAVQPSAIDYDPKKTYPVNVQGTQNIINVMKSQSNYSKIIFTSSISVYGDRLKNPHIKITDPPIVSPEHPYEESKLMAENLIRESGLKYSIFRLTYCTSTDMLKFRPVLFDMPLDTSVEILDTRDVATALVNAIESPKVWGRIFNLGGGEKCQIIFRNHVNDILEIMGFGRQFFPEEAFAKGNFHCGLYDTSEIQEILQFQDHTLEDFYADIKKWIGIRRYLIPLVRSIIRYFLLKRSKYWKVYKKRS